MSKLIARLKNEMRKRNGEQKRTSKLKHFHKILSTRKSK